MSLRAVQDYIARHGRVTLADLCLRFDSSPEAMRAMTARLTLRGRIARHLPKSACTGCGAAGTCPAGEYFTAATAPPPHPQAKES